MITTLRRGLAVAGFVLAAGAVALDNRWAGWGAIALLVASLLLRLADRHRARDRSDGPTL